MGQREETTTDASHETCILGRAVEVIVVVLSVVLVPVCESQCMRKPVMFNFGDSNSDTGGYSVGLGLNFGPPNGRTFFHQPSGRLCDGRLIIDFLCESLNSSYLTPYLESLGPNFINGANFAVSGSGTLPTYKPFNLGVQILQFLQFRARSLELISKGFKDMIGEEEFKNAIYTMDIGQNDLAASFTYLSYAQVTERIPSFIAEIKTAIWSLYEHGAKNFWIHNTGPLGCLPQKLATTTNVTKEGSDDVHDMNGCLRSLNEAAKQFNDQLYALCQQMRSQMKNATIVYVDIYSIKYHLIANSSIYGFENPLMACCGNGGAPYNYNPNITCGQQGFKACNEVEGSKYISWDGVHYTEAANSFFTAKILSTIFSTPPINFHYFCN